MLLGTVRFLRGYVDFEAVGNFTERFLNITARYGINLWEAYPEDGKLTGSMYVSDYRHIRKAARKSKVRLRITKKHGFPFLINRNKSRVGIPAGALAGFIIIMVLSNFIWSVSISGNETVSEQHIRDILAENGVYSGVYRGSVDVQGAKRNVQMKESRIGWMSINVTGSLASVELKENVQKPKLNEAKNPSNLKAKCDGVITDINVHSGVTKIKKGSGVVKGDLLVSGVVEKLDERYSSLAYVRSEGEVFADNNSNKEFKIPNKYEYYCLSDNKAERKEWNFLHINVPANLNFTTFADYASDFRSINYCINDIVMPIGLTTQTDYELLAENVTLNEDKAKQIFENEAMLYELSEKSDCAVVSRKMSLKNSKDTYNCEIEYVFNENIAENVDFSVTE